MRNPPWHRDELILALNLYLRYRPIVPGKTNPKILELSTQLNKLNLHPDSLRNESYRNPNSVYKKLYNFLSLDPTCEASGLQRGGKTDKEVWEEFHNNPERCQQVAEAIKATINSSQRIESSEDSEEFSEEFAEANEGRILTKVHQRRERSKKLVNQRKSIFLKEYGRLFCQACDFDFEQAYGERGRGFIECHHIKPLYTLKPGDKTNIKDLALVCSNCHRMIHIRRPWFTIEEVREIRSNARLIFH